MWDERMERETREIEGGGGGVMKVRREKTKWNRKKGKRELGDEGI